MSPSANSWTLVFCSTLSNCEAGNPSNRSKPERLLFSACVSALRIDFRDNSNSSSLALQLIAMKSVASVHQDVKQNNSYSEQHQEAHISRDNRRQAVFVTHDESSLQKLKSFFF